MWKLVEFDWMFETFIKLILHIKEMVCCFALWKRLELAAHIENVTLHQDNTICPAKNVFVTDWRILCQFGTLVMLRWSIVNFNNDTNMLCILCLLYVVKLFGKQLFCSKLLFLNRTHVCTCSCMPRAAGFILAIYFVLKIESFW